MTCIVGLVASDGTIWIGGDSLASYGYDVCGVVNSKVFRVGEMLIGASGSARLAQLVQHAFVAPAHPAGMDTLTYLVAVYARSLRACLTEHHHITNDDDEGIAGTLLIGYQSRLFKMQSNLSLLEPHSNYTALGIADGVALGSLSATPRLSARKRVRLALEAAAEYSGAVRGPFVIETLPPQPAAITP